MNTNDKVAEATRALSESPTSEVAWEAVELVVQQGTRVEGSFRVALAILDAISVSNELVVELARPLIQVCQGDPWAKFPNLLSSEHLLWAESEREADRCRDAGIEAAKLCLPLVTNRHAPIRRAASLVAYWEMSAVVVQRDLRTFSPATGELVDHAAAILFSCDSATVMPTIGDADALVIACCARDHLSDGALRNAVRSTIAAETDALWFDGDLFPALLFAAKTLRGDLPRTVSSLLVELSDQPFRVQSLLAHVLKMMQSMNWTAEELEYFRNFTLPSSLSAWTFVEVDLLRRLAVG